MKNIVNFFLVCVVITAYSCGNDEPGKVQTVSLPTPDTTKYVFIPVTEIIRGQLFDLRSLPVDPLITITKGGKKDSVWIKREELEKYAAPFLTTIIDSANMGRFFQERSFLDQTINAFTLTYEPKTTLPDSIKIQSWTVYIDPTTSEVRRVYIIKEEKDPADGKLITKQLTWKSRSWFKINSIKADSVLEQMKATWNFNEKSEEE